MAVAVAVAIGIVVVEKVIGGIDMASTGEENAGELVGVGL